VGVGVCM